MSDSGKKLNELRVCDLKEELEKRKLDTIGPKSALIERLEKVNFTIKPFFQINFNIISIGVYIYRLLKMKALIQLNMYLGHPKERLPKNK